MPKKKLHDAQTLLVSKLRALPASGRSGFEGAIAQSLKSLTGQQFHIAKSGHQGGSDARTDPANFLRVAMEGKRYSEKTRLGRDELKAKLVEASNGSNPADIWLLAATRSVDASDREALSEYGNSLGIGVMICDWPNENGTLHDLAVICAAGRDGLQQILKPEPDLKSALDVIAKQKDFQKIRERICHFLSGAEVGYDAARARCKLWFHDSQTSLPNAKSRLGGHNNLAAHETNVVKREEADKALTEWFHATKANTLALLGDEGLGKTWAAIDWANRLLEQTESAPLIVFLKATQIDPTDARASIAKALAKQTGSHNEEFWRRRIDIWERYGSKGVRILLLIDGLNENFQYKDWADWLQPLFEDRCTAMYRALITCWPVWWERSLKSLGSLEPAPVVRHVTKFNDRELSVFLKKLGKPENAFAPNVRELMRVPRLSAMVARHASTLDESGDITAERVIYEDWKDRIRRGQKLGVSNDEMRSFVAGLGERLKDDIDQTVTRADVLAELSKDSGEGGVELGQAVEALVSGAWLEPGAKPNQFTVSRSRLPFALGAALFDQVRNVEGAEMRAQCIAEFVDPLKANSIGAAILGAATTVALIETGTDVTLTRHLVELWLDEQNFNSEDFESFWRLAGLDPELFLGLAEDRWLSMRGRSFSDEVIIKALANASAFETFGSALTVRLVDWFATIWPDPEVGAVLGKVDRSSPNSKARSKVTTDAFVSWKGSSYASNWPTIRLREVEGWSWLVHRAMAIISYMNRAGLRRAFAAWAIGRAIMNSPRHIDELAWVLRINSEDGPDGRAMISELIAELRITSDPLLEIAASYLEQAVSHTQRSDPFPLHTNSPLESKVASNAEFDEICKWSDIADFCETLNSPSTPCDTAISQINGFVSSSQILNPEAIDLLNKFASTLVFLLTEENRISAADALNSAAIQSDLDQNVARKLSLSALVYALFGLDAQAQCELMLNAPGGAWDNAWNDLFAPLSVSQLKFVDTDSVPPSQIRGWLDYVFQKLDVSQSGESWDQLAEFIDDQNDSDVRYSALKIAAQHKQTKALNRFSELPISKLPDPKNDIHREIEYWRNRALLELCDFAPSSVIAKELSPETAALIVSRRPENKSALDAFESWFRTAVQQQTNAKSWKHPTYWHSYTEAVTALHAVDSDRFERWIEAWLDEHDGQRLLTLGEEFPFVDTVDVLMDHDPALALRLWNHVTENRQSSFVSVEDYRGRLFRLANLSGQTSRMDAELNNAVFDCDLARIVIWCHKTNCLEWLFNWIDRLEKGEAPVDLALSYTLLGFCDLSSNADDRWAEFSKRPPADSWLRDVFDAARSAYLKNRSARETVVAFWNAETHCQALANVKFLSKIVDSRIGIWLSDVEAEKAKAGKHRTLIWNLSVEGLNQDIKKLKEIRKKQRFHTDQAFRTMSPWC